MVPCAWSIVNSRQDHWPTGSGTLKATPAGLCSGSVASSDSLFHCSARFCPPSLRCLLPSEASVSAANATCPSGSAVVCRTYTRTYRGDPTAGTMVVLSAKAWLQ